MTTKIKYFFICFNILILSACNNNTKSDQEINKEDETSKTESEEPTLIHVTNFVIDTSKSLKELDFL